MGRVGMVYFDHRFAGVLEQKTTGFYFTYASSYLAQGAPLSFNLPLQVESFSVREIFSFFENLISEGWLKQIQCKSQKIDENDTFGLLLENGKDLIGAVTILKDNDGTLQDQP